MPEAGLPAKSGVRKHRKTFTGCWTCRRRKVKCDEAKPACSQCRTKSLGCEGYRVRLQWMPTDQSESTPVLPRSKVQRSQIVTVSTSPALESEVIDDIITSIDGYEAVQSSNKDRDSLFIHSFGVFDPRPSSMGGSPRRSQHVRDLNSPIILSSGDAEFERTVHKQAEPDAEESNANPITDGGHLLADPFDGFLFLGDGDLAIPGGFSSPSRGSDLSVPWLHAENEALNVSETADTAQPGSALDTLSDYRPWEDTGPGPLVRNPTATLLTEQESFLMYHYSHRAVNLFCVIDNRKSPWKTIHLPRALQSIGQLSIGGSSSSIRDALRSSLLSISAFYLSNDSMAQSRPHDAAVWTRKGTLLRCQALELLDAAVNNDVDGKTTPKYKEFLATMLSMVTINVMSGDTSTCGVHLDGALRFMMRARSWKTKFSAKARALHRIYFYLRAIYESTALEGQDTIDLPQGTPSLEVPRPSQLGPSDALSLSTGYAPQADAEALTTALQMSTYECIYGVPQNLLILLSRSTSLIREVAQIRKAKGRGAVIPADLAARCDELEQTIMDWPITLELDKCRVQDMGRSSEIIRHGTHAFRNALVIYFAQHVRLLNHRYLQSYVRSILESIEEIEKIKAASHMLAAPIYWPVFIAASEAFAGDLQDGFRNWYNQVEVYGIEAMKSGISVLSEVWRRGPSTGDEITSRWRTVVNETGAHLMLT